ncbi:1-phosphatidylinositol 3-phosphate 5-kinase [Holothuria leucospilota]|uniref:1-phosphatidylinositol-3-phosphate 5-kinase n=1 Tax=Holothuria leucospilota TaxID=206669 RepID=A0A9Q0YCS8_HOLLE|nr:1-phosphatidylinositol 3-phosphate 5-kinase [Holothuria leucospilota]
MADADVQKSPKGGNGLTFFPPLPSDVKGPQKKSSLLDLFKRPKDKTPKETAGDTIIFKSELEKKQEQEEKKEKEQVSRSKFYVSAEPRPVSVGSRPSGVGVKGLIESRQKVKAERAAAKINDGDKSAVHGEVAVQTKDESSDQEFTRPPRSLSLVMKQISNIRRGQADGSSFRQYWMPDSQCKECYECGEKFTTFRRRHHCRVCGQVFCHSCCNQEVASNTIGLIEGERVCSYCDKVLKSYTSYDASDDFSALQEDLQKFSQESPSEGGVTPRKKISGLSDEDRKQRTGSLLELDPSGPNPFEAAAPSYVNIPDSLDDEWKLLLKDSAQLRDLWLLIQHPSNGITLQTHRYRLRTYPNCVVGSELVDWLINKDKATTRDQAVAIGQALVGAKWIKSVAGSNDKIFRDDNIFYSPGEAAQLGTTEVKLTEEGEIAPKEYFTEPNWFQEIKGDQDKGYLTDDEGLCKLDAGFMQNMDALKRRSEEQDSMSISSRDQILPASDAFSHTLSDAQGNQKVQDLPSSAIPISPEKEDEGTLPGQLLQEEDLKEQFRSSSLTHLKKLLLQLLEKDSLDTVWFDIILQLAQNICSEVKVDVLAKDLMDIRQYVHIKKIPGGSKQECELVYGTVCTKNVTHKKMHTDLTRPKILLLEAPVEHQRVENKFVSLEPVVLQEREFLKNCVAKLTAKKPDVLIVEKTVARVAQDFLLAHGITLISNAKPLVVARIKRCTGASVVESIEQAAQATLGTCQKFHLKTYQLPGGYSKTLMCLRGCPPRLGCSVLLRGASLSELRKVKRCLQFMVYGIYHSHLEAAYLFDAFAQPFTEQQEVSSPGLEDSVITPSSGSFFEGLRFPQNKKDDGLGKSETALHGSDSQKSVTDSIKFAMQKFMKSHPASSKDDDNPATEVSDGDAGNGGTKMATAVIPAVTMVTSTMEKNQGQNMEASSSEGSEEQGPKEMSSKENPLKKLEGNGSEEKFRISSSDMSEVESKIIPFTPLIAPSGLSLSQAGMMPLAKPIKLNHFCKILKQTQLSSSPYVLHHPPFLETERGKKSTITRFLVGKIYSSPRLLDGTSENGTTNTNGVCLGMNDELFKSEIEADSGFYMNLDRSTKPSKKFCLIDPHPFLDCNYFSDENQGQTLLTEFRAKGGRLIPRMWRTSKPLDVTDDKLIARNSNSLDAPSVIHQLPNNISDPQDSSSVVCEQSQNEPIRTSETSIQPISEDSFDQVDCLDPFYHQRLTMQFSSFSLMSDNAPNYCIHPRTIQMEHYGKNDVTLGHFLDKFCFNTLYTCRSKSCETLMLQHIRRFVHGSGCIEIILRILEKPVNDSENDIIVWSWCRRCQEVLPYQTLSKDAWQMSFSKFLELRFQAKDYTSRAKHLNCNHSLHLHHNQYFSRGRIVATFKYHPIILREVVMPPLPLPEQKPFLMFPDPQREFDNIDTKGTNLLSSILQNITMLTETQEDCQFLEDKRAEYCSMYEDHQMLFKKHLVGLKEMIAELEEDLKRDNGDTEEEEKMLDLQDAFVNARRALAQIGMAWEMRFVEFLQQDKERKRREQQDKERRRREQQNKKKGSEDGSSPRFTWSVDENEYSSVSSQSQQRSSMPPDDNDILTVTVSSPPCSEISVELDTSGTDRVAMTTRERSDTGVSALGEESSLLDATSQSSSSQRTSLGVSDEIHPGDNVSLTSSSSDPMGAEQNDQTSLQAGSDITITTTDGKSSKSISKMKTMLNYLMSDQSAPVKIDMPFPPDQHYILPPCNIASIVIFDKEPSSIIAYTLSSDKYKAKLFTIEVERTAHGMATSNSAPSSGRSSPTLSAKGLDKPGDREQMKSRSPRMKHRNRVLNFLWNKGSNSPPMPRKYELDDTSDVEAESELGVSSCLDAKEEPNADVPKSIKDSDVAPSIVCQYTDPTESQFWCQVYFPAEFAKLRQLVFPSGEDTFIRSLSRCKTWKATGGKSGSKFSKTEDDRFVLKEIQRTESQSFLQFAPHYINYMEKATRNNQPTVLTKILGFFTIGCKNPITNTAQKQHVIVMENLFYKRHITKIFDLKGSIRNRHVKTSGDEDKQKHVLMDENLIKEMVKYPLYIRIHSKSILAHAFDADTKLLARHFVMDYSLLVGIDEDGELVVGIIDFIRKFTFDKKLEMIVKASGIVGGQGKTPTILSPELYRNRFCEAMDKYFVLVPDRWTGLGKDIYELHS